MNNRFLSLLFSPSPRAFSGGRLAAVLVLCCAVWLAASLPARAAPDEAAARLAEAGQLLVVVGEGWDSSGGVLRRFERDEPGGPWRAVGEPAPVALGRRGLAWGRGLHAVPPGVPLKREGDGRSPAGVFELGEAFGYSPQADLPPLRLEYRQALPSTKCVDDSASPHYNAILDQTTVTPDWRSAEDMLRRDGQYRYGLFVRHNTPAPQPAGGSCIFVHIWEAAGKATSGCTAMAEPAVLSLLTWLDAAKRPLLVQFPAQMLDEARTRWSLPAF